MGQLTGQTRPLRTRAVRRLFCGLLTWIAASASPLAVASPRVVVVTRAGIAPYEEVTAAFGAACRVRPETRNVGAGPIDLGPGDVVLAVGQQALDELKGSAARVVSALAPHVPDGVIASDPLPSPELGLQALRAARPSLRRLGVVYGPSTEALVEQLVEPARALGVTLVRARATDGPSAVRELNRIASDLDGLWLAPDLDLLVPQLFHFALTLQVRQSIPLAVVTRQQVKSGGLLAVDGEPAAVGLRASRVVNRLLDGEAAESAEDVAPVPVEVVVNGEVARRLGVDLAALRRLGARVE